MQQLGGLDNLMIAGEMPDIPLHMSALMIYDTAGKRGANAAVRALQTNFERLVDSHFPILRCRLEEVALQLDKAYWVEDPHFSTDYHITRVALPAAQDWPAMYRLFGQFHALPLDRARPLWQIMVVEGLNKLEGIPRGSTALFLKIHHAVMDGKSALRLVTGLHSAGPEPGAPALCDALPGEPPVTGDFRRPTWWEKYGLAWWHSVERPLCLAATLTGLLPRLLHSEDTEAATDAATDAAPKPPRTRFNQPPSADRVAGHIRLELRTLRRLEKKHGCTINDIALCVVAGALRDFLLERDELPGEDLQALMPIDIRRQEQDGSIGNHVSVARVCLHTSESGARSRLKAIHREATRGKRQGRRGSSHAMLKLMDEIHPAPILWLGRWLADSGHLADLPVLVNTVVTNVPGVAADAYLGRARLIDYLGFGPLAPNVGLFHTVSSVADHVNISFLSTAHCVGDGDAYGASLARSWAEVAAL